MDEWIKGPSLSVRSQSEKGQEKMRTQKMSSHGAFCSLMGFMFMNVTPDFQLGPKTEKIEAQREQL